MIALNQLRHSRLNCLIVLSALEGDIPSSEESKEEVVQAPDESSWRFGLRKVLSKTSGLCSKVSTLILRVVKTIFPWNRRAKRRLQGEGAEDDEL